MTSLLFAVLVTLHTIHDLRTDIFRKNYVIFIYDHAYPKDLRIFIKYLLRNDNPRFIDFQRYYSWLNVLYNIHAHYVLCAVLNVFRFLFR